MESISRPDVRATLASLTQSVEESALLLLGEHGIGKSHLLATVHAAEAPRTVLVRIPPTESRFPLAGFGSLFAALGREPTSEFHRYFSLRAEEPDDLFAAAHDLLALIRGLNLPPTVALIDDLDRMDRASRIVLGTIASHLRGTSLWLVGTASDTRLGDTLEGFSTLRLLPLSSDEVVEIASQDPARNPSTLHILASYAGGNPQVLSEQLDRWQADPNHWGGPLILPPRATPTIELVTAQAVDTLGTMPRKILELVALAPLSHVAALGQVIPDAGDDLEDLIDSGILRRQGQYVTFIDQRLRIRLYWDQHSRARRESHAELADAYAAHDERLATWHRTSAVREPHGVDDLLGAAVSLFDEGRIFAGVELAERALTRAERLEDHAASIIRLCEHLLWGGQLCLAERYSARIETAGPDHIMDLLNVKLMAQLFHRRHVVDDRLLTLADLHGEAHPEGTSTMLILGAAYRAERWEIDEARRLTDRGLDLADAISERTRLKLEAMCDIVDGLDGTAIDTGAGPAGFDADARSADPDLLILRARALTVHEAYHDARLLFLAVTDHASDRSDLRNDLATYGSIVNEINAGEFRIARTAIDTWNAGAPTLTEGTATVALLRAWYAYSIGAFAEAEEHITTTLELAAGEASQALRARALMLRGTIRLQTGDAEAAITDLRQVSAASIRFRNPTLLRHWADYTEVCVVTGRVQEAAATVSALERRLTTHRSRWGDLALMRCRALVETGRPSLALFDTAVKEFGRDELPYELGRTLRSLAIRQEELGMSVESRRTRMDAVAAFESSGADAWATQTEQGTTRTTASAAPGSNGLLEQLGPEEQAVAQCVMQGMRNREIAQTLFVSVRTVELRLTRAYRALGVRSRTELAAALTGTVRADDASPAGRS